MSIRKIATSAAVLVLAALAKQEWGGRCERPVALPVGIYVGDAFIPPRRAPYARRREVAR